MPKRKRQNRWATAKGTVFALRLTERETERLNRIADSRYQTANEFLKSEVRRLIAPC